MNVVLPKHFNIWINVKRALLSGAATVLFLSLLSVTNPVALGAGFVFGLLGGSTQDIVGWLGNREAIVAFNSKKDEDDT